VRIGELAERSGASVRALRYYEEQGLLSPQRTSSGQRIYDETAVDRVRLLRQLYAAGLSSSTIAAVLPCVDAPSAAVTAQTLATMREQYARIEEQIVELMTTRDQLGHLIDVATAYEQHQLLATA
jgi:DNA-binding transcriptional MerR regulator